MSFRPPTRFRGFAGDDDRCRISSDQSHNDEWQMMKGILLPLVELAIAGGGFTRRASSICSSAVPRAISARGSAARSIDRYNVSGDCSARGLASQNYYTEPWRQQGWQKGGSSFWREKVPCVAGLAPSGVTFWDVECLCRCRSHPWATLVRGGGGPLPSVSSHRLEEPSRRRADRC
jgi:hypothetical protein